MSSAFDRYRRNTVLDDKDQGDTADGCLVLILWLPITLFHAWGITVLWRWLLTPEFGWAVPSIIGVAGACMIARLATYRYSPHTLKGHYGKLLVDACLAPLIFLGCGWLLVLARGWWF